MKIICNQKLLANKIGISQKAINGKTTLELLKGILLSAKDGQLKLTGYDLEVGIETYTQAEVIEEGEIVVNARLFGDIIRKLPDSFVEIETDAENNVYINCLNSRFKIKGDSAKEYPRLPEVNEKGDKLKFYLSPNDLVYLPTIEEIERKHISNPIDKTRIYRVESFSETDIYFLPINVASPIIPKLEFESGDKIGRAITGEMIKYSCTPIKVDRLGNITSIQDL